MPILALAGGAVAAPIIGGVMANNQSKKAQAAFSAASAEAVASLMAVGIPSIEAQQIVLQNPQLVGQLVPELQQNMEQANSEMGDISVSPEYKQAQEHALDKLINMGDTPFTQQEQIDQAQLRREAQGVAEQGRASVLSNAQQRGVGGSGLEFAMNQAAQQQTQNALANQSESKMAQAEQRVLDSILSGGQLGGQIRAQEFGEQSDKARAQDIINQFNTANKLNVQAQNVGAKNNAQQINLQAKQSIENQRAGNLNAQEQYNKGLIQQDYENRLAKAQGIANAKMGAAGTAYQGSLAGAANKAAMGQAIGSGLGSAAMFGAAGGFGGSGAKATPSSASASALEGNTAGTATDAMRYDTNNASIYRPNSTTGRTS